MEQTQSLVLLDGDSRRRAAISHALSEGSIHVEPFEDISELAQRLPRSGAVLVHDDGRSVSALLSCMTEAGTWLPVIAYAETPEASRIVDCVIEGAVDYLSWPFARSAVSAALERAVSRADGVGNARLREAAAKARVERLTRREREVLSGVASGMSNRLIGEKLAISPRTVEIHRANMLQKMGASHTSEAIRIAIEAALVR